MVAQIVKHAMKSTHINVCISDNSEVCMCWQQQLVRLQRAAWQDTAERTQQAACMHLRKVDVALQPQAGSYRALSGQTGRPCAARCQRRDVGQQIAQVGGERICVCRRHAPQHLSNTSVWSCRCRHSCGRDAEQQSGGPLCKQHAGPLHAAMQGGQIGPWPETAQVHGMEVRG